MFKNMLKRSWLSTIRKPSRTVILVTILFVMANLLLATVAIKNSVAQSMQSAKNKLDATVNLTVDSEKLQEQVQAMRGDTESAEPVTFTTPTITEELAKGISESEYLKDYTYSISATANADGFDVVTTSQNEREMQYRDAFKNAQDSIGDAQNQATQNQQRLNQQMQEFNAEGESGGQTSGGPGGMSGGGSGGRQFSFNMSFNIAGVSDPTLSTGDTTIQGINAYSFISEVDAGSMTIVDGETFDENSGNGVIVSKELADANSLEVGGTIKLKTVADETEIELTILGIYQATSEDFNDNTVYMNIETAKQFFSSEQLEKLSVSSVKYYLNSAEDKDAFLVWASEQFPEIAENGLKLDVDTSAYDTMVGPIEKVGGFATTIMWIVMAASVVIITLIVVVNIKDRRYEMGVLLSLGATRKNIVGQVFLELILVGTIGFVLSFATSGIVADKLGEGLMSSSTTSSETTETESAMNGGPAMEFGRGRNAVSTTAQITSVNVHASATDYLTLFGVIYVILFMAMIVPSVNILRYQPKTILTGKE